MKNSFKLISIIIIVIALQSCQAYHIIDSGYDANSNFVQYKSFSWLPLIDTTNNSIYDNKEFRSAIKQNFTKQIIKRKYFIAKDTPDFYLDLIISYSKEVRYEDSLIPKFSYGMYYTHPTYHPDRYATRKVDYVKDYVTIHMVDAKTNQLIASVTSEADIDRGGDIPDYYNSITRNILRKFMKMKKIASYSN